MRSGTSSYRDEVAEAFGGCPAPAAQAATLPGMAPPDRRARAEARTARVVLRRTQLRSAEVDLSPLRGTEAVSLVTSGRPTGRKDAADVAALEAVGRSR
jgi:hypothetical protein